MTKAGWRPTENNYFGRVTKARIREAVRQGVGERAAQRIEALKKGEMAREAERLLADTNWLPEPLRTPAQSSASVERTANGGETALDEIEPSPDDDVVDAGHHTLAAE